MKEESYEKIAEDFYATILNYTLITEKLKAKKRREEKLEEKSEEAPNFYQEM